MLGDSSQIITLTASQKATASITQQRRSYHATTLTRYPTLKAPRNWQSRPEQKRNLHLSQKQAADLLAENGIEVANADSSQSADRLLAVTIDRSSRSPCIVVSPSTKPSHIYNRTKRFPYDYREGPSHLLIKQAVEALQLDAAPPVMLASTTKLIRTLTDLFQSKEAVTLQTHIGLSNQEDKLLVENPEFVFDDAAFRSNKRQQALHSLRDTSLEDAVEVSAEADGIVYIKLHSPEDSSACIGTLVNGAGLAMNTVDALADHGGKAANFLDTGGKATSETVKRSFELILSDQRVRVVFVNIFGGLTLCDMIANGIILAFNELKMKVPVVVRLRGTNEQLGQQIVSSLCFYPMPSLCLCLRARADTYVFRLLKADSHCMYLMILTKQPGKR